MKNSLRAGFFLLALGLHGQRSSVMFNYSDSLLTENAFEYLDTSNYITTGVLWDRIVPNVIRPHSGVGGCFLGRIL